MSKILCSCGAVLPDNTDQISYKGYFIADQDEDDFLYEIENKKYLDIASSSIKYFRDVFQCPQCNNIIFFPNNRNGEGIVFAPLKKEGSQNILHSYLGEKWSGNLVAKFENGKSEIWWDTNKGSDFILDLPLEELKELYYRKFEELSKLNILRGAWLRINGKVIHNFTKEKK